MYNPYTGRMDHNVLNYTPGYHLQPQYPSEYGYSDAYQSLRPPPSNTGYPSSAYTMNRTSSHGSSDSGYATKASSVASPLPQQSYTNQSYPCQDYVPNQQLSQQSAAYSYGNQGSSNIEIVHTAPVSSSKHRKERKLSNSAQSSPSEYNCLHPNCGHISSRAHDLKRHMTVHFPPAADELLDCKYEWCGRTGSHGFKREDHRKEHYRNVHMKASEYPKTGKGGRSSRNSGRSRP